MRIAIDGRKLRDYGIGTYVRNLLRQLARQDVDNEYVVFCRGNDCDTIEDLGPRFRAVVETAGNYSVAEQFALPMDLRREGAELFHAPHYVLPPLVPCRSVVTIHDCIHLRFPQDLPSKLGYAYARGQMWAATHQAARVITVSEASKRDILRYFRVPESRIDVIYNAIDDRFWQGPTADEMMLVRERYRLTDPFVLYAGNIKPHKNLERLIEAFHLMRQTSADLANVQLLIIGDEISKYATLRRAVHRHKLHKHVRFFGFVSDQTLAALYRLADAFVFPSLYEGFGLPPLEAMASGTPVITSNVSSLPEVVGDAALMFDPYEPAAIADAMHRVLTEPVLRADLRAKGLARAREFSWERFDQAGPRDLRRGHEVIREARGARRVALVHDWLTGMRGGEKVLEAIAELYPDATLHTLLHVRGSVSAPLERLPERRSFVQWLPSAARHYRQYLTLFPTAIEQFDFDPYDLVISTSHCAAKSVVVPGRATHVCYCHSPMRYAWDQFDSYFGPAQVGAAASRLLRPVLARLARWDAATAGRVDRYVANSKYVAGRIRRYYNRGSTVVYPPVDTTFYRPDPVRSPEPFFLVVSALVPYKRLDVAIRACAEVGAPLTIVGKGPEEARLRRLAETAGAQVEFSGWLDDEKIRELYQRCRAVLMPGVEDFGMVPVEAQACGRPVVALAEGGAVESVVDGVTGVLVQGPSVEAFAAALRDVSSRAFDATAIRRHAESFAKARFQEQFRDLVNREIAS